MKHRWVAVLGVALLSAAPLVLGPTRAKADTPATLNFTGSASATGVLAQLHVPTFPVTDDPVDGGGPTAQAAVSTGGQSTGYAAFPDPGPLVVSLPGLAAGLLATGAAGLPPIQGLPPVPPYPLFVSSEASSAPSATVGSGPYQLTANSSSTTSSASATAGFSDSLAGNAALIKTTASIAPGPDGDVVDTATSDIQGLTIGPLTIGEIKSTATEKVAPDGTVTPSSSMQISGATVAGIGISITDKGLSVVGVPVPVPVLDTVNMLLKNQGITIKAISAQRFDNAVIAPTLQITAPFSLPAIPNVGKYSGTGTLTFGFSSAQMAAAAAPSSAAGETPASTSETPGSTTDFGSAGVAAPAVAGLGLQSSPAELPATSTLTAPTQSSSTAPRSLSAFSVPRGLFNARGIYALLAFAGLIAFALATLLRVLGVRRQWISGTG